ncbi:histidine kinase [Aquiflexum sp. LQ15W]|uniref:sensor histidine kinase n=1 Tax=Cognataquiflexum nitidum TaxID=2922272 RepID=UPI001F13801B|nr:sensor histidine kinase [Cognataquiflexum nitidum]MCH6198553.1 histidine kinase [Cognataquiflexum nitidum]
MTYGTQHGLPVNQVDGLAKDRNTGVLVISTSNGLHQFNGYEFSSYRNHPFYSQTIFIGLFSSNCYEHLLGINMFGEVYHIAEEPELVGIFNAVEIRDEYILSIDSIGTVRYLQDPDFSEHIFQTDITKANFIHRLHPDTLIIADQTKTYKFLPKSGHKEVILQERIIDVESDPNDDFRYFLTQKKLYQLTSGGLSQVDIPLSVNENLISMFFNNGALLINSSGGLYYYYIGFLSKFTQDDILPTNGLFSFFLDHQTRTLFLGTRNKGLLKLTERRVVNLFSISNELLSSFGSLVLDSTSVYALAGGNLVKVFNQNTSKIFDTDNKSNALASLNIIGDTLFLGTWEDGIIALSKRTEKQLYHQRLGGKSVFATYQDPNGVFWVGTNKGVYTGNSIEKLIPFKPDTIDTQIITMFRTRSGHLWMGGETTIYHLDQNGTIIDQFGPEQGLKVKDVRAFYEDWEGRVWIGTYQGGLFCFHDNQLIELRNKPNNMLSNDIFTLTKDNYGNLLMSSNNGIMVVQEKALIAYLNNEIDYLVPFYIGVQSGVFNTEFNGGFLNNHINKNGSAIYFPSAQGIVVYLSSQIETKKTPIILKGVFADGKDVLFTREISRTTMKIQFEFFNVNYNEFENVYYQFKLGKNGNSVEWSMPSRATMVNFDFLPPGDYVFQVRAINGSNDPEPEVLSYSFRILPYFYERPLVQVGFFLIFLFLIFVTVQKRNQRKQQQFQRDLENKNTITELELNAIQAQMNPHIIFNSLNMLMHLIRLKSFEKAENFTFEFAQMLRNILERSGNHFIEIGQEIELLENYLQVQMIRFQNSIIYKIECEPRLYAVRIPSMMVQPLVENAIVHGLSNTTEGGHLVIRFEKVGDSIYISVEDDGIGRAKSAKIQEGKKRKSIGLILIHKKIDLMKSKYGISIKLNLDDLYEGERSGTKASLMIDNDSLANNELEGDQVSVINQK